MGKGIHLRKGEVEILMRATNYSEVMLAIKEIKRRREKRKEKKRKSVEWRERVVIKTLIMTLEKEYEVRPSTYIESQLKKLRAHI